LTNHITHKKTAKGIGELIEVAIDSYAITRAITYAIEQPDDVDIKEMIIRPTKQSLSAKKLRNNRLKQNRRTTIEEPL